MNVQPWTLLCEVEIHARKGAGSGCEKYQENGAAELSKANGERVMFGQLENG